MIGFTTDQKSMETEEVETSDGWWGSYCLHGFAGGQQQWQGAALGEKGKGGVGCTMRFGSTAKVLLKCKLKYYRISE